MKLCENMRQTALRKDSIAHTNVLTVSNFLPAPGEGQVSHDEEDRFKSLFGL